jgi:hypothetical protein
MKFEKIKTAADKRVALEKRGKETSVDLKAGNVLFVTEKLDGFNASFDTFGNTYSRSGQLPEDMKHHQKLVPFKEMVTTNLTKAVKNFLNPLHEYQVFGEFMVTDRIVPYKENVYNKHYLFDIYDITKQTYLGASKAKELAEYLIAEDYNQFMELNVLESAYMFTTYQDLEEYVYSKSNDSIHGLNGVMEGAVVTNQNGLRVKIVNKDFKETQRLVTNSKAHTKAVQWLNQYLTQNRVSKIVKNMITEGQILPGTVDYFVGDLAKAVDTIWNDIESEAFDKPEFQGNDWKNVRNKIEAKARLTMRDEAHYQ